mmetsp:Transcript_26749/g.67255  ORF Transcript_26749/g.67255 Transcript_26749/m.67255 type:complete len:374 (-) Transcript_26749:62-1183(-)
MSIGYLANQWHLCGFAPAPCMLAAIVLLSFGPCDGPSVIASITIEGHRRPHGWASTTSVMATPLLLPNGPTILPIGISSQAIIGQGGCRGQATSIRMVATPLLLLQRPTALPIMELGIAIVRETGSACGRSACSRYTADANVLTAPVLLLHGPALPPILETSGTIIWLPTCCHSRAANTRVRATPNPLRLRPCRIRIVVVPTARLRGEGAADQGHRTSVARGPDPRRARLVEGVRPPKAEQRGSRAGCQRGCAVSCEEQDDEQNDAGAAPTSHATGAGVLVHRPEVRVVVARTLSDEGVLVGLHVGASPLANPNPVGLRGLAHWSAARVVDIQLVDWWRRRAFGSMPHKRPSAAAGAAANGATGAASGTGAAG